MLRNFMSTAKTLLSSRLTWLPLAGLLTFSVALPLGAQETPPSQEDGTLLKLSVSEQIVPVGEELIVEALVEDVEHLAAFDFTVEFDSDQVRFVRAEETATFLASGGREAVTCEEPAVSENAVTVSCVALAPPVCAGGPSGVSGDGLLGRLIFEVDAPGSNDLSVTESHLILDDVEPCEEAEERVKEIPHSTEDVAVLFTAPSHEVQETPALIRLTVPQEQVEAGQTFAVRVQVEDVEHLSSFLFEITFDPELLRYEKIEELGQFLALSERQDLICSDPAVEDGTVSVTCGTRGLEACFGGPDGPSGSGLLGSVMFMAVDGGTTNLELTDASLFLDDISPCDPTQGVLREIPHSRKDASVQIAGSDSFPWLVVGVIASAVAVVLVGGGWLLRGRRSRARTSE